MIRFLICNRCRRSWSAPMITPCDVCGDEPIDARPGGGDAVAWLFLRMTPARLEAIRKTREASRRDCLVTLAARAARPTVGTRGLVFLDERGNAHRMLLV